MKPWHFVFKVAKKNKQGIRLSFFGKKEKVDVSLSDK
jgi:hypothetical protein